MPANSPTLQKYTCTHFFLLRVVMPMFIFRFTGPKNHKLLKCICTKSNNPIHNFRYAEPNLHIVWIYLIPIYSHDEIGIYSILFYAIPVVNTSYSEGIWVAIWFDVSIGFVMHLTRLHDPVNHLGIGVKKCAIGRIQ